MGPWALNLLKQTLRNKVLMAEIFIVAVAIYGYAMVSERSAMSPITAPMVFTTIGLVFGTGALDWFNLDLEGESVAILVEATLVLVLFTDAVRIDLRALRREFSIPARLLGISLPLTIVAGTALAVVLFPDLSLAEAALLAAVLAPTDAALGQAVVSDKRLPVRVRQSLNVESGLNDGIVVPIVTVLIAIAAAEAGATSNAGWGVFVARQIGFGMLSGVAIGAGGAWLLHRQASRHEIEGVYRQLATIAIAAAAFSAAALLDGNGFIAAFVAGLAFGHFAQDECRDVADFTEDEGELLTSITFITFGAVLIGPRLDELSWEIALYAVASLTVVRMVPTLLSMIGTGSYLETRLFAGWFGPRGLASILFALIVLEGNHTDATEQIFTVAMWTVLLSVFAHGLTASSWTGRLARRLREGPEDVPELTPMEEMPTRRQLGGE